MWFWWLKCWSYRRLNYTKTAKHRCHRYRKDTHTYTNTNMEPYLHILNANLKQTQHIREKTLQNKIHTTNVTHILFSLLLLRITNHVHICFLFAAFIFILFLSLTFHKQMKVMGKCKVNALNSTKRNKTLINKRDTNNN